MSEINFTPQTEPPTEPNLRRNPSQPKGVLQKNLKTFVAHLREPDVLSPGEFAALFEQLPLREKAMVMLAGSTGLRRSELVALTWGNIDPFLVQINVVRSFVRNHFGSTKTEASRKPVPLHASVIEYLDEWRRVSPYNSDDDFLFPSVRLEARSPSRRTWCSRRSSVRLSFERESRTR